MEYATITIKGAIFMKSYVLKKELIYSTESTIIDADCDHSNLIVLLKGQGEAKVELNGQFLFNCSAQCHLIRLTKNHFCLLELPNLHFYSLQGQHISSVHIGCHISQLFPYKEGVFCIYTDEGVFGDGVGKNILNFAAPKQNLQSLSDFALSSDFLYDAIFARFKPFAAIPFKRNEILLFDDQLQLKNQLQPPLDLGNVISFSIDFEKVIFLEENQIIVWYYLNNRDFSIVPYHYKALPQTINFRHSAQFIEVLKHEIFTFTIHN